MRFARWGFEYAIVLPQSNYFSPLYHLSCFWHVTSCHNDRISFWFTKRVEWTPFLWCNLMLIDQEVRDIKENSFYDCFMKMAMFTKLKASFLSKISNWWKLISDAMLSQAYLIHFWLLPIVQENSNSHQFFSKSVVHTIGFSQQNDFVILKVDSCQSVTLLLIGQNLSVYCIIFQSSFCLILRITLLF